MRHLAYVAIVWLVGCLFGRAALAQVDPSSVGAGPAGKPASVQVTLNPPNPRPGTEGILSVTLDIKPGFHAQSHTPHDPNLIALDLTMSPAPGVELRPPIYPPGVEENYPALGKLSVYSGQVVINVPFRIKPDSPKAPVVLQGKITYQICDNKSCYPPQTTPFSTSDVAPPSAEKTALGLFGLELSGDSYFLAFVIALAVGIIFNLMPCVLPVVPLKIIGFYEVSQHQRGKCFLLGTVFSLGIVTIFGVLAALILVSHTITSWGEQFSNRYFLGAMVLILLIMALSMFGVFSVLLPTGAYRFTPRHDTYMGNFLFGILTAMLSTPCTAPMFLPLLLWATSQPTLIGILLIMTVGVGMAAPYLVLSAFPEVARRFPRTGPWAELIKHLMGFLLIAAAVYFARPFIQHVIGLKVFWWTIFAIVAMAALFLVVRAMQFSGRLVTRLVVVALALLITLPAFGFAIRLTSSPIDWLPYTPVALETARSSGRPIFIEFTADWCTNCQTLEAFVFHDARVVSALRQKRVIAIRADVTDSVRNAADWKLLNSINPGGVGAIPLTVIYSPKLPQPIQISGVYTVDRLLTALDQADGGGGK